MAYVGLYNVTSPLHKLSLSGGLTVRPERVMVGGWGTGCCC